MFVKQKILATRNVIWTHLSKYDAQECSHVPHLARRNLSPQIGVSNVHFAQNLKIFLKITIFENLEVGHQKKIPTSPVQRRRCRGASPKSLKFTNSEIQNPETGCIFRSRTQQKSAARMWPAPELCSAGQEERRHRCR